MRKFLEDKGEIMMEKNTKNHKGQVCVVDALGRIVIPSTIRKAYDISKNEALELITLDEGILMRKYQPDCIFCGNISNLTMFKGRMVCHNCLHEMSEKED